MDSDDLLASFRHEWQKELSSSSHRGNFSQPCSINKAFSGTHTQSSIDKERNANSPQRESPSIENKAAELFKHGIWLEQNGQLYESIKFYRKAIAMVPDIELIVHHQHMQERLEASGQSSDEEYSCPSEALNEDDMDVHDLVARFEALMNNNQPICKPMFAQETPHISCLPMEMIEKILLWVVGQDLDLISLDKMAAVSRGFYLICRKPDIWRRACLRVWGIKVGNSDEYGSWRLMFLTRPRPQYNGCYISKTTYFRSGDNGFQDENYKPWHLVTYYRYIRFFPNGEALMLTTADEPQSTVSLLKKDSKSGQIFQGHYRIHGNSVTLLFRSLNRKGLGKKRRNCRAAHGTTDVAESTYQIEFEIKSVRGRPNWQMAWKCYSIVSCYFTGACTTSILDVSDTNCFPPMNYSRVKSYAHEANLPLS